MRRATLANAHLCNSTAALARQRQEVMASRAAIEHEHLHDAGHVEDPPNLPSGVDQGETHSGRLMPVGLSGIDRGVEVPVALGDHLVVEAS